MFYGHRPYKTGTSRSLKKISKKFPLLAVSMDFCDTWTLVLSRGNKNEDNSLHIKMNIAKLSRRYKSEFNVLCRIKIQENQ